MTIEYVGAIDDIYGAFLTAWNANSAAIAGYVPTVYYQGVQPDSPPDSSKIWCRISHDIVLEQQTTLSNCEGAPNQKRYTTTGLVFVQVFGPKEDAEVWLKMQKLAKVARNAYRGKSTPGRVWFRNARIKPLADEELYKRFNVIAEFEYDELG